MPSSFLNSSFFQGGFECSSHRLRNGRRVDVLAATRHDELVRQDYQRLRRAGISVVRDGLRWHLIEQSPRRYHFQSWQPMLHAARDMDMQVIWDVCHYGWPDDVDIFRPEFVSRYAAYARAVARYFSQETDQTPFFCPINEISFFSWGGGEVEYLNPFQRGRGLELKTQLVQASLAAMDEIRAELPHARFCLIDPAIHIAWDPSRPHEREAAEAYRRSMFEAWDMLSGRAWPQLGGSPEYLDIIGVNYYWNNQWIHHGGTIGPQHPLYRPFGQIVQEIYHRYQRPVFIAETGIENEARPDWLRYMCQQAAEAMRAGVPLEGMCLYPILNHPGWDDDRHCRNGLWDYPDAHGHRDIYQPFADELQRQQPLMEALWAQHRNAGSPLFAAASSGRGLREDRFSSTAV